MIQVDAGAIADRLDELRREAIEEDEMFRDYCERWKLRLAEMVWRRTYAAERAAPEWVDLGGEG